MFTPHDKLQNIQLLSDIYADHRNIISIYPELFSTVPLLVTPSKAKELNDFYNILVRVIHKVVENYFYDVDINRTISFNDDKIFRILSYLEKHKPYNIGALRPDFLIEQHGSVKLCEINGRFISNGIIISEYLSDYYSKFFDLTSAGSGMLNEYCKAFDLSENICILKGKESGRDIFFLQQELKAKMCGGRVTMATPQQLRFINGSLVVSGEKYTQFILELHQTELVELNYQELKCLFMANTINDFRTIMIVHDKRMFTLLSNRDFLMKYLSGDDADKLMEYIPLTFLFKGAGEDIFLKEPKSWVLKKSDSGKGDGMYICDEMSPQQIKLMCCQNLDNYIMQQYIHQKKQLMPFSHDGKFMIRPVHHVGALASFNNTYHGMMIVRGSPHQNVSVAHGATIFMPLIHHPAS